MVTEKGETANGLTVEELKVLWVLENDAHTSEWSVPIQKFFCQTKSNYPNISRSVWINFFKTQSLKTQLNFLTCFKRSEVQHFRSPLMVEIEKYLQPQNVNQNVLPYDFNENVPTFPTWLFPAFTTNTNTSIAPILVNLVGVPASVQLELLKQQNVTTVVELFKNVDTSKEIVETVFAKIFNTSGNCSPEKCEKLSTLHKETCEVLKTWSEMDTVENETWKSKTAQATLLNANASKEMVVEVTKYLLEYGVAKNFDMWLFRNSHRHPNMTTEAYREVCNFLEKKYQTVYKEMVKFIPAGSENFVLSRGQRWEAKLYENFPHLDKLMLEEFFWYSELRSEILASGAGQRKAILDELFECGKLEEELRHDQPMWSQYFTGFTPSVAETIFRSNSLTHNDLCAIYSTIMANVEGEPSETANMLLAALFKNPQCDKKIYTQYLTHCNHVKNSTGLHIKGLPQVIAEESLKHRV